MPGRGSRGDAWLDGWHPRAPRSRAGDRV